MTPIISLLILAAIILSPALGYCLLAGFAVWALLRGWPPVIPATPIRRVRLCRHRNEMVTDQDCAACNETAAMESEGCCPDVLADVAAFHCSDCRATCREAEART